MTGRDSPEEADRARRRIGRPMTDRVPILVAGGGPVGMMLALELGRLGTPCLVVEQSTGEPRARANLVAARSMEYFRRLGIADAVRAAGLPPDYPHDTAYRTTFLGEELHRVRVASSGEVRAGAIDEDIWPTPEPQHRVNQMYLERILRERARDFPGLTVQRGTRLVSVDQRPDGVRAELESVETGQRRTVHADWLVGCDGTRSTVRRQLGLRYEGVDRILQVISVYFRSAELTALDARPAWMTFTFNPHHVGAVTAIDGERTWVSHHHFQPELDISGIEPAELLEATIGRAIDFETLDVIPWTARAMVVNRYRAGRVFLAGDAAHDWVPAAGFGMNAGIGDAVDLAWKLAGVHRGWGGPALLESYETERRPLGATVARALSQVGASLFTLEPRMRVHEPGEAGAAARAELARILPAVERGAHQAVGLNFGYQYDPSPIVWPDGTPRPEFSISHYEPRARPGARLPHVRLAEGTPVFDRLGDGFTLLRVGDGAPGAGPLMEAAADRGVPVAELALDGRPAAERYGARLVLVRPDQHVAWRGDALPSRPLDLIDLVRGAKETDT